MLRPGITRDREFTHLHFVNHALTLSGGQMVCTGRSHLGRTYCRFLPDTGVVLEVSNMSELAGNPEAVGVSRSG